jgi:hypothetical protein
MMQEPLRGPSHDSDEEDEPRVPAECNATTCARRSRTTPPRDVCKSLRVLPAEEDQRDKGFNLSGPERASSCVSTVIFVAQR